MKLSEYIEGLQKVLDEHGDLDCFYASDDEGNDFITVSYKGTVMYTDTPERYRLESLFEKEEIENDEADYTPICVVN